MKLGIYRLNCLSDTAALASIEAECGAEISILSFYRAWNCCSIEDDLPWLGKVLASSRDILLTWEPWIIPPDPDTPENQPDFSLSTIISGRYDPYIRAFASALAQSKRTVFLRPMHEMNGCWYPWCGTVNGNSPEKFSIAWKHLRKLFSEAGAANVKWIWSPYASSHPNIPENCIDRYFPGDDEIDCIALDGYNWGESTRWGKWQSFTDLLKEAYDAITALSAKPVIIAETGCSEVGGSKAAWIEEMFVSLGERFGNIEALVWFDIDKECDWRIASSGASLTAFRTAAAGYFKITDTDRNSS